MSKIRSVLVCVLMLLVIPSGAFAEEGSEALNEGKHKINFNPFHLSLFKRGRVVGQAELRIVLQLEDGDDYEEFNNIKTQIRADFTSALTELARIRFDVNRPINPDVVKAYLTPFADYRLGEGRVQIYVMHATIEPK
ncbi:MAG: hypothetical protein JKY34_12110 [Kordiimonadaceae bacterium]|nr:hypothetical protein [Kordiimonadaceae bacterium]